MLRRDNVLVNSNILNSLISEAMNSPFDLDDASDMRYSARAGNIQWKQDETLQAALAFMENLFSSARTYIYRHRLQPGQCLVSNNVLHNRSGFRDSPDQRRVIHQVRYQQRIRITGL